jgi:hypothetical protein
VYWQARWSRATLSSNYYIEGQTGIASGFCAKRIEPVPDYAEFRSPIRREGWSLEVVNRAVPAGELAGEQLARVARPVRTPGLRSGRYIM